MFLLDNPVLQRELLVSLRMPRAFVLLFAYVALLGIVVYAAWPQVDRLDLRARPAEALRLVNMFFLGQYVLLSRITPSVAAGTITGEKEKKTYEMLLASPMRPAAIVLGKLLAAMVHLAVLVFCSLPIVMLCLPLGGVHYTEVLATYVAMAASVLTFGMISMAASSYFPRTVAAQLVSYLIILPMALLGVLFYGVFQDLAAIRLLALLGVFPSGCLVVCAVLMAAISKRLMHPPDVGAEAQEVVDLEEEQREAIGMVIRSDQFPDNLFAPPKRSDFMSDGVNPVFDKEIRSELFGHGTLMLRLVIQLSMALALLIMAVCLYIKPAWAPWYVSYVLLFNMLVGPVFAAGSVTNERERQTLELLLTTTLSPWQILSGKLYSSLRVSVVLTSFLVWPLLLAWLLPPWTYWRDTPTMVLYLAVILVTCLTTTTLGMFSSLLFRRTPISLMASYLAVIVLFAAPIAVKVFADAFYPGRPLTLGLRHALFVSPFAAAFSLPLGGVAAAGAGAGAGAGTGWWDLTSFLFLGFYAVVDLALARSMIGLFNRRWRVM
ncbi:MAG: ABC transporter permease subunit [Planctomycetota bacterium]|nr:ABC transporter permease subunit [Planctomycetota bacterium]